MEPNVGLCFESFFMCPRKANPQHTFSIISMKKNNKKDDKELTTDMISPAPHDGTSRLYSTKNIQLILLMHSGNEQIKVQREGKITLCVCDEREENIRKC